MLDSLHGEVLGELGAGELSTIVGPQHLQFAAGLLLSLSLDLLHRLRRLVLGCEQRHEHEARGIVHHEEEVAPTSWSRWCDGSAQVAVDELQRLLGAVRSLLWERLAAHLGGDAGVADLCRVLDHRNALGHLLPEPMESVEVQMSKPLVPAPGIVVLPRGETNRLHGVEMKNVKAVAAVLYLGKEALALILDTQDAVLDLHLRARFIELTQGHDGVAKRRDEVDAVEDAVLAVLHLEHNRAHALDLHA